MTAKTAQRTVGPLHVVPHAKLGMYRICNERERAVAFSNYGDIADVLVARSNNHDYLLAALRKLKAYNEDIRDGKINYRPNDHIEVASAAIARVEGQS